MLGPPVSNLSPGPNLTTWRASIAGAATLNWPNPPLTGDLKAIIINFFVGNKPSVDVDNMAKPILDEMQNIVYRDDRQIVQAEITHLKIGGGVLNLGCAPDYRKLDSVGQSLRLRPDRRRSRPVSPPKVTP